MSRSLIHQFFIFGDIPHVLKDLLHSRGVSPYLCSQKLGIRCECLTINFFLLSSRKNWVRHLLFIFLCIFQGSLALTPYIQALAKNRWR
jgi:hypothetical protein